MVQSYDFIWTILVHAWFKWSISCLKPVQVLFFFYAMLDESYDRLVHNLNHRLRRVFRLKHLDVFWTTSASHATVCAATDFSAAPKGNPFGEPQLATKQFTQRERRATGLNCLVVATDPLVILIESRAGHLGGPSRHVEEMDVQNIIVCIYVLCA